MRNHRMDLNHILELYNEKGADSWNEALSSADARYKYERPFKEGYYDGNAGVNVNPGVISYLYAAQGKRSNHRAWWLKNRFNYLDGKFKPYGYIKDQPSEVDTFSFRMYSAPKQQSDNYTQECVMAVPPVHSFNLTALNNSYLSMKIGSSIYGPVYTLAGETSTIGPRDSRHEVEAWILNPTVIQDLGDLSNKYIGSLRFPSGEHVTTRLTSLKFGQSKRSHEDTYEKYFNDLLQEVAIGGSCPYLQDLNIARCRKIATMDLSLNHRLLRFDAEGCTNLKTVTFPKNSILQEIYLPENFAELKLINQPHLTTLALDNPSKLNTIILDNVPNINSYSIVKELVSGSKDSIKQFYLTNVDWIVAIPESNI